MKEPIYEYDDAREVSESHIVDSGTLAQLNKSEIDQQIATAKRWPRSIKKFRDESLSMVTLTEKVAEECIYAVPRDGKTIEGPSARFAEVIASAWGNCRAGARVIGEDTEFVTAQGAFYDLERNVAIQYEVKRRIVDKRGQRFKPDMIAVTANAACSIALRNAILKGVPKAFWADMYDAARLAAVGDIKSIANKRAEALAVFQKMGVTNAMIFTQLNVNGIEDIGVEELVTLKGIHTALKEGDTTIEQAFSTRSGRDSEAAGAATDRRTEDLRNKYVNENPSQATSQTAAHAQSPATEPADHLQQAKEAQERVNRQRGQHTETGARSSSDNMRPTGEGLDKNVSLNFKD